MHYFGDAPRGEALIATPVGEPCARCEEPIQPGDIGITMPLLSPSKPPVELPYHECCFRRTITGSAAHQLKRCSCYVPGSQCGDDPAFSTRDAARLAVALYECLTFRDRVDLVLRDARGGATAVSQSSSEETTVARGINKVILIGNLGGDPDIHALTGGGQVANLSVATTESWRDKGSGATQQRTEWHKVSAFGRLAEIAQQYLHKGDQVYIEGSLRTSKWPDKSGQQHSTTEIVAKDIRSLWGALGAQEESDIPY